MDGDGDAGKWLVTPWVTCRRVVCDNIRYVVGATCSDTLFRVLSASGVCNLIHSVVRSSLVGHRINRIRPQWSVHTQCDVTYYIDDDVYVCEGV